jgi:hypothetical protein
MDPILIQQAKDLIASHGKSLALDMVNLIIFKALEQAVKKSVTPIDDVVLAALEAPLKQAAIDMINKL